MSGFADDETRAIGGAVRLDAGPETSQVLAEAVSVLGLQPRSDAPPPAARIRKQ